MMTKAYAAHSANSPLIPYEITRRALQDHDVLIEILYCGVCHSDLHIARNDWGVTQYPAVPGHEIVGKITAMGSAVTKFSIGDHVAVGCMVDSCQNCDHCHHDQEQYCPAHIDTYNAPDKHLQTHTLGGYSGHIVVREEFTLKVPNTLDLSRVAPLVCAGITTYSPLRHWGVGPGTTVGVVGLGGLGHMAVKLASAMGASVTVISRSMDKAQDALALGADALLVSSDPAQMQQALSKFDLIIDTVPVKHDINPYLPLLKIDSTLVMVGQIGLIPEISTVPVVLGRRQIAGSFIGGIKETQELLDFCGKTGVLPDCEIISMDQINRAYTRMERSDVRYRFVIDMNTL